MPMHDTDAIATELLAALDGNTLIAPITARDPDFDEEAAYRVSAEILRRRRARGERPIGRKIGFTNRTFWPEYGVFTPIWAHVYDQHRDVAGRAQRKPGHRPSRTAAARARDRAALQERTPGHAATKPSSGAASIGSPTATRSSRATSRTGSSRRPIPSRASGCMARWSSARRRPSLDLEDLVAQAADLHDHPGEERQGRGARKRIERAGESAPGRCAPAARAEGTAALRAVTGRRACDHRYAAATAVGPPR